MQISFARVTTQATKMCRRANPSESHVAVSGIRPMGMQAARPDQPVICVIMSPMRFQNPSGTYSSAAVMVR